MSLGHEAVDALNGRILDTLRVEGFTLNEVKLFAHLMVAGELQAFLCDHLKNPFVTPQESQHVLRHTNMILDTLASAVRGIESAIEKERGEA